MKKLRLWTVLMLIGVMLLTACGNDSADAGKSSKKDKKAAEAVEDEEEEDEDEDEDEDGGEDETDADSEEAAADTEAADEKTHKDLSELIEIPEIADAPEASETKTEASVSDYAQAFAMGDVENNGGYFVRVGSQVYTRLISPLSLDAGAMFGEFLYTDKKQAMAPLVRYDLNSHTWEELFSMTANGKLYACPNGFYVGDEVDGDFEKRYTWFTDIETGHQTYYCDGAPVGISKSGEILAVEKLTGQFVHLQLIKDSAQIADLGGESGTYQYCGFVGEDMIALYADANDEYALVSIDAQGKETNLGTIPVYQVEGAFGYPSPGQFVTGIDDLFYLGLGYYEGTGHFLAGWQAVTAQPGVANSLILEKEINAYELEIYQEPRMLVDAKNALAVEDHVPGDVWLTDEPEGKDLMYCEPGYASRVLIKGFILPADERTDKLDSVVQDIACFGETVFMIYADVHEDEEYAVGWRTGYALDHWYTCALPFDEASLDANGRPTELQFIQSVGPDGEQ